MQEEITEPTPILNDEGHVISPGWARDDYWIHEREKIGKGPFRRKDWDFWEIYNDHYSLVLNIFDIGYAGVGQLSLTNFDTGKTIFAMMLKLFTKGSVGNPKSWKYEQPLTFTKKGNKMEFKREGDNILLYVNFPKKGISGEFTLYKDPKMDSMVNLIPFEDPTQFVYAVKIMCMPATGTLKMKDEEIVFNKENRSWGVLDWTRAVFPYKNHWKWCTASGIVNGVNFGFNIDYGFGIESSKSMIIYDGKGHHLDVVTYQHDMNDLKAPLKISSPDGRVNLTLKPKHVELAGLNLGIAKMKGHNTFGYFTGEMVLDDGTKITINEEDKLFGWAEEFWQKW